MASKFPIDVVSVDCGNVTFIIRRSAEDELQLRERNLKSDVPDTLPVSPQNIQVVEVILRAKQWCRPVTITVEGGLITEAELQE